MKVADVVALALGAAGLGVGGYFLFKKRDAVSAFINPAPTQQQVVYGTPQAPPQQTYAYGPQPAPTTQQVNQQPAPQSSSLSTAAEAQAWLQFGTSAAGAALGLVNTLNQTFDWW